MSECVVINPSRVTASHGEPPRINPAVTAPRCHDASGKERPSCRTCPRRSLLHLVAEGSTVATKVRGRLAEIAAERERIQAELSTTQSVLDAGAGVLRARRSSCWRTRKSYTASRPTRFRRQLNQAFFERLYIDDENVADDVLAEPLRGLLYRRALRRSTTAPRRYRAPKKPHGAPGRTVRQRSSLADLLDRIAHREGSSKAAMVELRGLNP
jgi:site-specific DNA recombinase